jgi:O-antigen/teichoic acid export membrane protein
VFCLVISLLVCLFAPQLMGLFLDPGSTAVIEVGVGYLRIEAAFYLGIGVLFLLYGYFRAVNRPAVSVVLTVCSLGTRVGLAYLLSGMERWGVTGIWLSIPIGWLLADAVGIALLFQIKRKKHRALFRRLKRETIRFSAAVLPVKSARKGDCSWRFHLRLPSGFFTASWRIRYILFEGATGAVHAA